jgi:hypothetical protein
VIPSKVRTCERSPMGAGSLSELVRMVAVARVAD